MSLAAAILDSQPMAREGMEASRPGVLRPDHVVIGEAAAPFARALLDRLGIRRVRVPISLACADRRGPGTLFEIPPVLGESLDWLRRRGVHIAPPGAGTAEAVYRQRFAAPGRITIWAGTAPLAIGAYGSLGVLVSEIELVAALAGSPIHRPRPSIVRVGLGGSLAPGVSGHDLALELLRRLRVPRAPSILEYGGTGATSLSMTDRTALDGYTTALGAEAGLFPSDSVTHRHLGVLGRAADWKALEPGPQSLPDQTLDLDGLEPLMAPLDRLDAAGAVRQHAGLPVGRVVFGPRAGAEEILGLASFLRGRSISAGTELWVVPGSRQMDECVVGSGAHAALVEAGGRLLVGGSTAALGNLAGPGIGLCCGVRSQDFSATASRWFVAGAATCGGAAVAGEIVDARELRIRPPPDLTGSPRPGQCVLEPAPDGGHSNPDFDRRHFSIGHPLQETIRGEVLLKLGAGVGTTQILPWGARMDPIVADVPAIAARVLRTVDVGFARRARERRGGWIVAGHGFGHGESNPYAALALASLDVRVTLALSYGVAFYRNLLEAGLLPLRLARAQDLAAIEDGDELELSGLPDGLQPGRNLVVRDLTQGRLVALRHDLDAHDLEVAQSGGLLRMADRLQESFV